MSRKTDNRATVLVQAAALRDAGRLAEAAALYEALAAADPMDAEPHHHLGGLHLRAGRQDLAEVAYRQALALAPGAAGTRRVLGVLLLSQGRFVEGFALAEARHELPRMAKPQIPFPEWRGEPVAGKRIAIWPEQGFGDQIQFARFAPVLKAMGAEVTLLCRKALARLFAGSLDVEVIAAEGSVSFPDPDYWVMCCSVAARLGVTLETIPTQPYLRPLGAWPGLPHGLKVGVATKGNPAFDNDANRSLPPDQADRLARLPATVIDLDPARSGASDFADTAAIIDQLDLVVAVDTAVAHLAGAMGKPCWILIPAEGTDWRWMHEREDSPWYPSARLFRQRTPGDWSEAIARVEAAFAGRRKEKDAPESAARVLDTAPSGGQKR